MRALFLLGEDKPIIWAFLVAQMVRNLPAMQKTRVQSLGWEDPLEKGMATHSSILTWRIPWTQEPGGLQSMGSQRADTTEQLTHTHSASYAWTTFGLSVHAVIGTGLFPPLAVACKFTVNVRELVSVFNPWGYT